MSVPNVGLQNKGKSELRMESNLVTIGCLKREEEIVFLKAKKKIPARQFFKDVAYHDARQETATKVNHQESEKKTKPNTLTANP